MRLTANGSVKRFCSAMTGNWSDSPFPPIGVMHPAFTCRRVELDPLHQLRERRALLLQRRRCDSAGIACHVFEATARMIPPDLPR